MPQLMSIHVHMHTYLAPLHILLTTWRYTNLSSSSLLLQQNNLQHHFSAISQQHSVAQTQHQWLTLRRCRQLFSVACLEDSKVDWEMSPTQNSRPHPHNVSHATHYRLAKNTH